MALSLYLIHENVIILYLFRAALCRLSLELSKEFYSITFVIDETVKYVAILDYFQPNPIFFTKLVAKLSWKNRQTTRTLWSSLICLSINESETKPCFVEFHRKYSSLLILDEPEKT